MTKLVLALLALTGFCDAFWRMSCSVIQEGRIDPIVSPGKVASHAHKISGASSKATPLCTRITMFLRLCKPPKPIKLPIMSQSRTNSIRSLVKRHAAMVMKLCICLIDIGFSHKVLLWLSLTRTLHRYWPFFYFRGAPNCQLHFLRDPGGQICLLDSSSLLPALQWLF